MRNFLAFAILLSFVAPASAYDYRPYSSRSAGYHEWRKSIAPKKVYNDGSNAMKAQEAGKTYNVVIIGSPNVNPGYRLVHNAAYPQIAADYEKMFRVLKSLPCDIFLGAHGSYFDLEAKYARLKEGNLVAFVDPEGYKMFVADKEQAFKIELAKQRSDLPQ